jgi:hypothetical protein
MANFPPLSGLAMEQKQFHSKVELRFVRGGF